MKTMENQTTSTKQVALTYGLILGFVSVIIQVIIYAMGKQYEKHTYVGIGSFLIMVVFISYGIFQFKKQNGGYLSFGEGLKTGIAIALIAGLISIIYSYVFMNFIEPDFMSNMMQIQQDKMMQMNPNMTDEQMNTAMTMAKKFSTPWVMMAFGLLYSAFIGFIISLVATLVMKKNKEEIHSI